MAVSKKRILNIASTKKRDQMRLYDPSNPSLTFFSQNRGASSFLWCPTYRLLDSDTHVPAARNASTVYMKGLSEKLHLSPSTGHSWKWRRIVFETVGAHPPVAKVVANTSEGYLRLWTPQPEDERNDLANTVFEGTTGVDFSTYFTAKVDRHRVKIHYDRTQILRSGNDVAYEKDFRLYHSFDKNFYYDDEENGEETQTSGWASNRRGGLGNVFVWDLFNDIGAPEGASMTVRSGTTLYWHEK